MLTIADDGYYIHGLTKPLKLKILLVVLENPLTRGPLPYKDEVMPGIKGLSW